MPFIAFMGVLLWGGFIARASIRAGMTAEQNFGFLQNLLSEGLGVLLAVVAITPLTTYFTERQRRQQLAPVREQFYKEVANKINEVGRRFVSLFSLVASDLQRLQIADNTRAIDNLVRALASPLAAPLPRKPRDPKEYEKYRSMALLLARTAEEIAALGRSMESVERLVDIYSPFLSPQMVAEVAGLSSSIADATGRFFYFSRYLQGRASQEEKARARLSGVEFAVISNRYDTSVTKAGFPELRGSITEATNVGIETQLKIVEAIREIVEPLFYDESDEPTV